MRNHNQVNLITNLLNLNYIAFYRENHIYEISMFMYEFVVSHTVR